MGKEITGIASEFYVLSMLLRKGADATFTFLFTTIILKTFLCFLKFLLGLVLIVLVFSGCEDPSRLEIPEGAEVEFVWGASPQVSNSISGDKQAYSHLYRYFLDLHEEEKDKWVFKYPKGYDEFEYDELYKNNNEEYFKELYEKAFEKVFASQLTESEVSSNNFLCLRNPYDIQHVTGQIEERKGRVLKCKLNVENCFVRCVVLC